MGHDAAGMEHDLEIRHVVDADRDQVIALARRSLGWAGDARDRAYFAWKHDENPFGPSYAIGAFDRGRLVGFRTMMRWRFERGHESLSMVRAVDTATDPDHQGRGIFRRLTMRAVEDLTEEGVDAVFNTPNDQSRPGYLKMGWVALGRPTIGVHPRGLPIVARMLRSRVASEKWSEEVTIGVPAADADWSGWPTTSDGWSTPKSPEYLRWRYGFGPLRYRVVEVGEHRCVLRVRRRGDLREVALCEWPPGHRAVGALHRLVAATGDYGIGIGVGLREGFVPLPKQGPVVTRRALNRDEPTSLDSLSLALGDLELF